MTERAIKWGNAGFVRENWLEVLALIKYYDCKSVLEYGCGLSTELLDAIGIEYLSLETQEKYIIEGLNIQHVDYRALPELNRIYDLALIDGPGAYEFEAAGITPERKLSADHARKYSNIIYIHDGGLGQIEGFDDDWTKISKGDTCVGFSNIVYLRKKWKIITP